MDIKTVLYEGYSMMDDPTYGMSNEKLKLISDYIIFNLDFKDTKPDINMFVHALALMMILAPSSANPMEWKLREVMLEMSVTELNALNEHFRSIADNMIQLRD